MGGLCTLLQPLNLEVCEECEECSRALDRARMDEAASGRNPRVTVQSRRNRRSLVKRMQGFVRALHRELKTTPHCNISTCTHEMHKPHTCTLYMSVMSLLFI